LEPPVLTAQTPDISISFFFLLAEYVVAPGGGTLRPRRAERARCISRHRGSSAFATSTREASASDVNCQYLSCAADLDLVEYIGGFRRAVSTCFWVGSKFILACSPIQDEKNKQDNFAQHRDETDKYPKAGAARIV
jgi:hypothetical protein